METKWLEDFVSLAETRSFSRSAQLRHVTQPAFSRRIQALEAWAGIDLVDRSSYPTRLTSAGQTLLPQALEILGSLQAARNLMRGHQTSSQDMIEFAVPHSLAFTFFPHWVMELRQRFGAFKSRLVGMNVHDAVMQLTEGSCDLLLAYHHASQPLQLNPQRHEHLSLGTETLAPYARAGLNLYRDGRDSVAMHNDRIHDLAPGQPIAILSLGAARDMLIKPKRGGSAQRVRLAPGSVLVMSHAAQRTHDHGIPKCSAPLGPRISLAFRVRGVQGAGVPPAGG